MQTISKTPHNGESQIITSSPTQHHVKWDGQVVGMIQCSPESGDSWEYCRYSQYPKVFIGTYSECTEAAQKDYDEQHENLVTVVRIHHTTTQPAYKAQCAQGYRATWKTAGAGNSTKVTIKDDCGELDIWIPASFAAKLQPGNVCIHRFDKVTHQDYLAWSKAPVRRSAIAA